MYISQDNLSPTPLCKKNSGYCNLSAIMNYKASILIFGKNYVLNEVWEVIYLKKFSGGGRPP